MNKLRVLLSNQKILAFLLISLTFSFLISCGGKQKTFRFIEDSYKDGTPHIIKFYKSEAKKILLKETVYYKSGKKKIEGSYLNDKKDGKWQAWFPNGKLWSEATYSEGTVNGLKTVYYENGNTYYTGKIENDKRVGEWSFWDKDGKLLKTVTY